MTLILKSDTEDHMADNTGYVIDKDMSERFKLLKFIFMVMVVFLHSQELPVFSYEFHVPEWVQTVKVVVDKDLFLVAVPGFFIMSSILLYHKSFTWKDNIKKKVRSILVPYVLINTFWLLFFVAVSCIPALAPMFSYGRYSIKTWKDVADAYFGAFPLYYPFWFLRDLFVLNLAASLLKMAVDRVPVIAGLAVLFVYFSGLKIPLLRTNDSFFYWMVGLYLVRFGFDLKKLDLVGLPEWTAATVVAAGFVYYMRGPGVIMIYTLIAFGACYVLCGRLTGSSVGDRLVKWSAYSFFIFAFHEFYEAMIKKIIMSALPQPGIVQLVEFLGLPVLIVVLCVFFGQLMQRWFPRLYAVLMGGRNI